MNPDLQIPKAHVETRLYTTERKSLQQNAAPGSEPNGTVIVLLEKYRLI